MFVKLRDGDESMPVMLFPGAGGEPSELAPLAMASRFKGVMYAVTFLAPWAESQSAFSVENLAARCAAELSSSFPGQAFRLVGYSFGGLVALETARRLIEAGGRVESLVLVDAVYERTFWPGRLYLKAIARRATRQLARNRKLSLGRALRELGRHFRSRKGETGGRAGNMPESASAALTAAERSLEAMQVYRPKFYAGPITLLRPADDAEFAVDIGELWRPLVREARTLTVAGNHMTMMNESLSLSDTAKTLDGVLNTDVEAASGLRRPVVLLAAAFRWFSTARLALALHDAGFEVNAICPRGHMLERVEFVTRTFSFHALAPLRSLRAAIAATNPDLILPCDDFVAPAIHALWRQSPGDPILRALIERSLGSCEMLPLYYSRAEVAAVARAAGVKFSDTISVADRKDIARALPLLGNCAMMKADFTWGGDGVVKVTSEDSATSALRRLSAPPQALRAFKHLIFDRDATSIPAFLRRKRRRVSLQRYVEGKPATASVACYKGRILDMVLARVIQSNGATGPATVIEIVENPEMRKAIALMVEHLALSGLVGFDFILADVDAAAHMIEVNPRATPTIHLVSEDGVNLCDALFSAITGKSPKLTARLPAGPIALFPQEIMRDPNSEYLTSGFHDLPSSSNALLRLGQAGIARASSRNWRNWSRFLRW